MTTPAIFRAAVGLSFWMSFNTVSNYSDRLPTESPSRAEQSVDPPTHIHVLYNLAPAGLFDASLHARYK
jgi:hypothetical protein